MLKMPAADLWSVSPQTSLDCGCWLACPLYRRFVTTVLVLTVCDCALQWKPLGRHQQTSYHNVLLKDSSPLRVEALAETQITLNCLLNFEWCLSSTCSLFHYLPSFCTAGHNYSQASGSQPFLLLLAPFNRIQISLTHTEQPSGDEEVLHPVPHRSLHRHSHCAMEPIPLQHR